jgi:cobalt-zinc-cadmium efflux system membrane fusion protein
MPRYGLFEKTLLPSLSLTTLIALTTACDSHPGAVPTASSRPAGGEARLTQGEAQAAGITIAAIAYQELGRRLPASGRITFDDQRVTHVFSPVSGRVVRLVAQPGQRVHKGEPLAVIESPDLGSAVSDQAKAQAALEAAARELQRQKELFAVQAAAQRELEAAEANERQARAELVRTVEKARLLGAATTGRATQSFVLRSPIAGEVIARAANPGVEVQGQYSGGTAVELYTVGEVDRVWALADVFEADLARVAVGAPVTVEVVAFPGRHFNGRIDWIATAVDPATRTARVRCALDNRDRALKPEMYATISIPVSGHTQLALPRSALLRQGDQTLVFRAVGVAADGSLRFVRWPVKVGDEGSDSALPVLSGLHAGDRVVTSGGVLLLGMV